MCTLLQLSTRLHFVPKLQEFVCFSSDILTLPRMLNSCGQVELVSATT